MADGVLPTDNVSLAAFLQERCEGFSGELLEGGRENEVVLQGIVMRFLAEYDEDRVALITTMPGTLIPAGLSAYWDGADWEPA